MSRAWRQSLCVGVLLMFSTSRLRAQSRDAEVILTEDTVSATVFEVLHDALTREGIGLRRSVAAAACSGKLDPAEQLRARVWLQWTKHLVTLCFQDACGSSTERVLGPFSDLDARAREEIITVIESGLAALSARCLSVEHAEDAVVPPAPPSTARVADSTSTPAPQPQPAQPAPASISSVSANGGTPATSPAVEAPSEDEPASTLSELPKFVHAQSAAESGERNDATAPSDRTLLLAARYGITRWSSRVVGQYLGGAIAYSVHPHPLFIGIEVDYAPPFGALQDGLAIHASSLRLAVQLWARWRLAHRAVLDVQLGPALESLSVSPVVPSARMLQDRHSVDHLDPYLFARAGPSLCVYKDLFVGIALQLDASFLARSYGFVVGEAQREVFAPDRVRMSVALQVRAEL